MSENIEITYEGKFYKYKCDREVNPYDILIWLKDIKSITGALKQSISDGYISIIDNPHLKNVIGTLIYEQGIRFTSDIQFINNNLIFTNVNIVSTTEINIIPTKKVKTD